MKKEKSEEKAEKSDLGSSKVFDKIVPDTSVIVDGMLSKKIEAREIIPKSVLIHEAVVAELEHQANEDKAIGFLGLDEIIRLRELSEKFGFSIEFSGKRPSAAEIKYASLGEIDSLIRDLAFDEDAALITADKVQARAARAKAVNVLLLEKKEVHEKIMLESFFDNETMSVHLRENVVPVAKKGKPGDWKFVRLWETPILRDKIQAISSEIIEDAGLMKDGFIEIERPGSTIVQLGEFRIVITKPPFSDGWEITAVRPIVKLHMEDYELSENLRKRIAEQAEGILIAGAPGMGKSTFAQALAMYYAFKDKIVKTIEAPRDLILPEEITQYAISHGTPREVHDILLLSRPDYTIFDEMRNTSDFKLFADLRLAGIGLAGVVHATNPIDAIQRFVGRIELGVIPQIIDTVIFIKNGKIDKVLNLKMVVKVPSGMTEADLARPVVVVTDFETKKLEYELYSYGEETVVVPVTNETVSPTRKLAAEKIKDFFRGYSDDVEVEMTSENRCIVYVPEKLIAKIIGKEGSNINKIEEKLGVGIDVKELTEQKTSEKEQVKFSAKITKKGVMFSIDPKYSGKSVDIVVEGEHVMSANVGKDGIVKISKKHKIGRLIIDAVNSGSSLDLMV